jgi:phosphomannomutase
MAPKFGTSGLRGLVTELTPELVADHVGAFARACPVGTGLFVARDLRPSSPDIAEMVIGTGLALGLDVTDCGRVPTPALALAAMGAGAAAIMVTGSHIPADRNGLKFYLPTGEIAKSDERAILAALGASAASAPRAGIRAADVEAGPAWVARYANAFGARALAGLRVGIWSHSAVSRDLLLAAFAALGAEEVEIDRSDTFVPLDTEAVPGWARENIRDWVAWHRLDALVSTDGDGDRPLLADETGRVVPGDVLGQITAGVLDAETVVTPVSSNSGVALRKHAPDVIRTRIGSPFVIAGMEKAGGRVVGYEANGGFLLGFSADLPAGPLAPLATRDSLLPLVAPLSRARDAGGLAALVAAEPARFTATDRLQDVDQERSQPLVAELAGSEAARAALLSDLGEAPEGLDQTDGLRIVCRSGRIVHVRPSGNAPELRFYVEAESAEAAGTVLARGLDALARRLR